MAVDVGIMIVDNVEATKSEMSEVISRGKALGAANTGALGGSGMHRIRGVRGG